MISMRAQKAIFTTFKHSIKVLLDVVSGASKNKDWALERTNSWADELTSIAEIELKISGSFDYDKPCLLVSNHSSQMDIPILMKAFPHTIFFLAKKELRSIPFFGRAMEELGFVFIERGKRSAAIKSMNELANLVKSGRYILTFPEGTRSSTDEMLPFKKGVFLTSIKTGLPIFPMVVKGSRLILPTGTLDLNPGTIEVVFGKAVEPPKGVSGINDFMNQVRSQMQEMLTSSEAS